MVKAKIRRTEWFGSRWGMQSYIEFWPTPGVKEGAFNNFEFSVDGTFIFATEWEWQREMGREEIRHQCLNEKFVRCILSAAFNKNKSSGSNFNKTEKLLLHVQALYRIFVQTKSRFVLFVDYFLLVFLCVVCFLSTTPCFWSIFLSHLFTSFSDTV